MIKASVSAILDDWESFSQKRNAKLGTAIALFAKVAEALKSSEVDTASATAELVKQVETLSEANPSLSNLKGRISGLQKLLEAS